MNKEIFEALVDIITQQEFAKTQQEYFEKNAKLFEDTEENKLEYTNIHTEYVYILDTVVEANLKEKYTSDQIDAFYLGFKDNLEEYKKINPEVVNTLFSFIDFEAFKKSILLSKNFLDENYGDKQDRTQIDGSMVETDMDLKYFEGLLSEDINDPKLGWHKSLQSKGTEGYEGILHQRAQEGKSLNLVRNQAVMKGASLKGYNYIGQNYEKYQEEFDTYKSLKENKKLRHEETKDGSSSITYSRSKMGGMLSDRENLIKTDVLKLSDTKIAIISKAVEMQEYPVKPDCVRMEFFKAS